MGEAFTIQISSELISRLAEGGDKQKKTRRSKPKVPKSTHQPESKVAPPAPVWPLQPVQPINIPPPLPANAELDRIQAVLRESENMVERVEKHRQDLQKEVTQRAKELHEKEFKLPYQKPMPCVAEKDGCLSCYKEHLKDPLKCADAVKRFEDCSRRVRQQSEQTLS